MTKYGERNINEVRVACLEGENMQAEREVTFEIKEHIGVINEFDNGWNRELNIVSWNGQAPKYDIRDWDGGHERMSRGITLHPRDMRKVVDLYLADNSRKAVKKSEAEQRKRAEERERTPRRQFGDNQSSTDDGLEEREQKSEAQVEEGPEINMSVHEGGCGHREEFASGDDGAGGAGGAGDDDGDDSDDGAYPNNDKEDDAEE